MDDVVAVVTDLFFQARVAAASASAGRSLRFLTKDTAVESVQEASFALVDVDADIDVQDAIRTLAQICPVVAFGPHVDAARRRSAREAGAHRVLAKSAFVRELPSLLAGSRGPASGSGS